MVGITQYFSLPLLLPSLALLAPAAEKAPPRPAISVNYPSYEGDRFITLTLDGFPQRNLTIKDHGAPSQVTGILVDDFLSRAGWSHLPQTQKTRYVVHVEGPGGQQAAFPLGDPQAWLVIDPSKAQATLVMLNEQSAVKQRLPGIRTIRVSRDSVHKN